MSEYRRFLDVNVLGMFLATRAQSAAMKKQDPKPVSRRNSKRGSTRGVIVNMGSASSFVSTPMLGQYTTSKHAVLGLSKNAGMYLFSKLYHDTVENKARTFSVLSTTRAALLIYLIFALNKSAIIQM